MKYTALIVALICILFTLPFVSAAISVGNVVLDNSQAVDRSNPLLTHSDTLLDDLSELQYVTFNIPVTANAQSETVNSITPNLNGFTYDSFSGSRVNSSLEFLVDTPLPLVIEAGQTQTISVRVLVPSNLDAIDTNYNEIAHTLSASLSTSAGTQISTLSFFVKNELQLQRVTINAADGTTISCKVTQGSTTLDCNSDADKLPVGKDFSVDFTLKNKFSRNSNVNFNGVDVSLDSDNSDVDPSDTSYTEDINSGDTVVETTSFNVDSAIQDGDSARITIEASIDDDNGAKHGFSHDFDISFNAKDYELATPIMSITPTSLCPGDNAVLSYTLENLGGREQTNVRPILNNDALALNKILPTVDLKVTGRSGDIYRGTTSIVVPTSTRAGSYPIQMLVYYRDDNNNNDATLLQTSTVIVQSCTNGVPNNSGSSANSGSSSSTSGSRNDNYPPASSGNQTGGLIVVQPGQTGTTSTGAQPTSASTGGVSVPVRAVVADNSDTPYLIGLGVGLFVLLVVVGLLITALMRK